MRLFPLSTLPAAARHFIAASMRRISENRHTLLRVLVSGLVSLALLMPPRPVLGAENFIKFVAPKATSEVFGYYVEVTKPKVDFVINYSYSDSKTKISKQVTVALMISDNGGHKELKELYYTGGESGTATFTVDFSQAPYSVTLAFNVLAWVKEAGWGSYTPNLGDGIVVSYQPASTPTPKPSATATPRPSVTATTTPTPLTPAAKPVIVSFLADPLQIKAGEKTTLKWRVTGADSVTIDGVPGFPAQGSTVVTPLDAQPMASISAPGQSGLFWRRYDIKAVNTATKAQESSYTNVGVEPLTIDEIYDLYVKWGNKSHKWPDGTEDDKALVGPGWSGGTNNFSESFTILSGIGSLEGARWDCNAMQYRTLVFLNETRQSGKLAGWDYMGVEGAAIATTGVYPNHKAAAIWRTGDDWSSTATILDPHDKQQPDRYSVTAGLDSMAPWHPDADYYGDVYPSIPTRSAAAEGKYLLNNFDANTVNRWGNGVGAKTPWQNLQTLPRRVKNEIDKVITNMGVPDDPTARMILGIYCPVDVLITNSAGKRLGRLPNGTMITEFRPLSAFYEAGPKGDKQWMYLLPKDSYKVSVTGTGSGPFKVQTYTGGTTINDYGDNSIGAGGRAALTLKPGTPDDLTLPSGKNISPKVVSPDSLWRTTPSSKTTQTGASSGSSSSNLAPLIIFMVIGAAVVVTIIALVRRPRKKATATAVAASVGHQQVNVPAQQSATAETAYHQGVTCTKCGQYNPSTNKFCKKCGAALEAAVTSVKPNFCPRCGDPVSSGEKLCDKCGLAISSATAPTACPKCGSAIKPGNKFCNKCGVPLQGGV